MSIDRMSNDSIRCDMAGATAAGAATGVVGARAVCGVTAFSATIPVTLTGDLPGCFTTALEDATSTGGGGVCALSSSFIFCNKATRAAAWAGVSAAWTEMKLAPRMMHKPKKILIFIALN
jgi:hypothetical protein